MLLADLLSGPQLSLLLPQLPPLSDSDASDKFSELELSAILKPLESALSLLLPVVVPLADSSALPLLGELFQMFLPLPDRYCGSCSAVPTIVDMECAFRLLEISGATEPA